MMAGPLPKYLDVHKNSVYSHTELHKRLEYYCSEALAAFPTPETFEFDLKPRDPFVTAPALKVG